VSVDYQSGNVSFVVANGTVPRDLKGTTVLLVNVSTVIDGFVSNDSFPSVVSAIAQDIEAYVATREHPYTSAKYQRLSAFDHQVRGSMAEVEQDINLEIGVAVDNYGLNLSTPAGFGVVQLSQDDVAQMVRAMAAFLRPEPGNHSSLNLSTEVINHSLVNITYQEGILQRTDCDDDPPDWESVAGAELYPCYTYTDISPPLCTEDGEHGLGWDSDGDGIMDFGWGRIETHGIDTAGISAFDACCLCGGGKDFNVSGAKVHYVISTDLEVSESVAGPAFAEGLASAVNDAKREGGNVSTSRPRDIIRLSADFVTRLNFTLEITVDTVAGEIVAELVQQLLDLALTNASLVQHIRTAGGHASNVSVLDVSIVMVYEPIEPVESCCSCNCADKVLDCNEELAPAPWARDGVCDSGVQLNDDPFVAHFDCDRFESDFGDCVRVNYTDCGDHLVNYCENHTAMDGWLGSFDELFGCTNPNQPNFGLNARLEDQTCQNWTIMAMGCMNSDAFNYDPAANIEDGGCVERNYGCVDPTAFNFVPTANTNDGSCVPVYEGCLDPTSANYNATSNTEDRSCDRDPCLLSLDDCDTDASCYHSMRPAGNYDFTLASTAERYIDMNPNCLTLYNGSVSCGSNYYTVHVYSYTFTYTRVPYYHKYAIPTVEYDSYSNYFKMAYYDAYNISQGSTFACTCDAGFVGNGTYCTGRLFHVGPEEEFTMDGADNSFMTIEDYQSGLLHGNSFTVSLVLFTDESYTSRWRSIFTKGDTNNDRSPALFYRPLDTFIRAFVQSDGDDECFPSYQYSCIAKNKKRLTVSRLYHIVVTVDSGQLSLYLDGVLDSQLSLPGGGFIAEGPLYIGSDPWNDAVKGYIKAFSVHAAALDATEIAALFLDDLPIMGCMDPEAWDCQGAGSSPRFVLACEPDCEPGTVGSIPTGCYNPDANREDGTCIAPEYGCIDDRAENFDAPANTDDGSCDVDPCRYDLDDCDGNATCAHVVPSSHSCACNEGYVGNGTHCDVIVEGCNDPTAFNYDIRANLDDGSCIAVVYGCISIIGAENYNATANTDDGSCYVNPCTYGTSGCSFNATCTHLGLGAHECDCNYGFVGNGTVCSAVAMGCTDDTAINYDKTANVDDGSCIATVKGCMDSRGLNYDELANVDDGSCNVNPCVWDLDDCHEHAMCGHIGPFQYVCVCVEGYAGDGKFCAIPYYACTYKIAVNYDQTCAISSDMCLEDGSCIFPVYGCTNANSDNYDVDATVDDGSCQIFGCTNDAAENFNPSATYNDYSCVVRGCRDPIADNFDYQATHDGGNCEYILPGCTYPNSINYNPLANFDNSSCIAIVYGCTHEGALNFEPLANVEDSTCQRVACDAAEDDCHYNATCFHMGPYIHTCECNTEFIGNGSYCEALRYGCMDAAALNYDPLVNTANASCVAVVMGCMNETAINYDPAANVCNKSCSPHIMGCTDVNATNFNLTANTDDGTCNIDPCWMELDNCSAFARCAHTGPGDFSCHCDDAHLGDGVLCVAKRLGCMNSSAFNFDPKANMENNSCIPVVNGCMDYVARNYAATANVDDGGCVIHPCNATVNDCSQYATCVVTGPMDHLCRCISGYQGNGTYCEMIPGCMYPTAMNYNPVASQDDGSCYFQVLGCTERDAVNFVADANVDDGSCFFYVFGCTYEAALNYDPAANVDDKSCIMNPVFGCMNATAFNFDPRANVDNVTCEPFRYGCIDAAAYNFTSDANTDDGSCNYDACVSETHDCHAEAFCNFTGPLNFNCTCKHGWLGNGTWCELKIFGCSDPEAFNYNASVNVDTDSCISKRYGCIDNSQFNYDPMANMVSENQCVRTELCAVEPDAMTMCTTETTASAADADTCSESDCAFTTFEEAVEATCTATATCATATNASVVNAETCSESDCTFTAFEVAVDATCVDKHRCAAVVLGESTSEADCVSVNSFGAPCVYTAADAGSDVAGCAVGPDVTAVCVTVTTASAADADTCSESDCAFTTFEEAVEATCTATATCATATNASVVDAETCSESDCTFTAFEVAVDATCVDKHRCAAVVLGESTSKTDCVSVNSFGAPCVYTASQLRSKLLMGCQCEPIVTGCINETALNFDSSANTDDGRCQDPEIAYLSLHLSSQAQEVAWKIVSADRGTTQQVLFGSYQDYGAYNIEVHLPGGKYSFIALDEYGDGWAGETVRIVRVDGSVALDIGPTGFEYEQAHIFSVPCIHHDHCAEDDVTSEQRRPSRYCSDLSACEKCIVDDNNACLSHNDSIDTACPSKCDVIRGCTDETAVNYERFANVDAGNCTVVALGCTNISAINYNETANTDDGSCVPARLGCTDPNAMNYDEEANVDDGQCNVDVCAIDLDDCHANATCAYIGPGLHNCTCNRGSWGNGRLCNVTVLGCMNATASNYDNLATTDDGSCMQEQTVFLTNASELFESSSSWGSTSWQHSGSGSGSGSFSVNIDGTGAKNISSGADAGMRVIASGVSGSYSSGSGRDDMADNTYSGHGSGSWGSSSWQNSGSASGSGSGIFSVDATNTSAKNANGSGGVDHRTEPCWYDADSDYVKTCASKEEVGVERCECRLNGQPTSCTNPALTKSTCLHYAPAWGSDSGSYSSDSGSHDMGDNSYSADEHGESSGSWHSGYELDWSGSLSDATLTDTNTDSYSDGTNGTDQVDDDAVVAVEYVTEGCDGHVYPAVQVGDGTCHEGFNCPELRYDNGDCARCEDSSNLTVWGELDNVLRNIHVRFSTDVRMAHNFTNVDCNTVVSGVERNGIVHSNVTKFVGDDGFCSGSLAGFGFLMHLSFGSTIAVGDKVYLSSCLLYHEANSTYTTVAFVIEIPTAAPHPTAIVTGPVNVGLCGSLALSASSSVFHGPQPFRSVWSCEYLGDDGTANIVEPLRAIQEVLGQTTLQNSYEVAFSRQEEPFKSIPHGTVLAFVLAVTDVITGFTSNTTHDVTVVGSDIPQVVILGPSEVVVRAWQGIFLHAVASKPACGGEDTSLDFEWSASTEMGVGLHGPELSGLEAATIHIPPQNIMPASTILFRVVAKAQDADGEAVAHVRVRCVAEPLVASIRGGSRSVRHDQLLHLDATASVDPDDPEHELAELSFHWNCAPLTDENGMSILPAHGYDCHPGDAVDVTWPQSQNHYPAVIDTVYDSGAVKIKWKDGDTRNTMSSLLDVFKNDVACIGLPTVSYPTCETEIQQSGQPTIRGTDLTRGGSYRFDVTVSKGGRSDNASVVINIAAGEDPPEVAIETDVKSKYNVDQALAVAGVTTATQTRWSLQILGVAGDIDMSRPGFLGSGLESSNLVISPGALTPDTHYTLRLDASSAGGEGYSQIGIFTNALPADGTLVLNPSSGTALRTNFLFTASGWHDAASDLPLRYRFGYRLSDQDKWLTDASLSGVLTTVLPSAVNDYSVIVAVMDVYDGVATAYKPVKIDDYIPVDSMATESKAMMDELFSSGDVMAVSKLVEVMAATVNQMQNRRRLSTDSPHADLIATRVILARALHDVVAAMPLTENVALRLAGTAETVSFSGLSGDATDDGLVTVGSLSHHVTDTDAISSLIRVVSDLLGNSVGGFSHTSFGGRMSHQVRGDRVLEIVHRMTLQLMLTRLAGEFLFTVPSANIDVYIHSERAADFTVSVANGLVDAPQHSIANTALTLHGRVVNWKANPYYWDHVDGAKFSGAIASTVAEFSCFYDDGTELQQAEHPISVTVQKNFAKVSNNESDWHCAAWTGSQWKLLGDPVSSHPDQIFVRCEHNELTAYAAIFGSFDDPPPPLEVANLSVVIGGGLAAAVILACFANVGSYWWRWRSIHTERKQRKHVLLLYLISPYAAFVYRSDTKPGPFRRLFHNLKRNCSLAGLLFGYKRVPQLPRPQRVQAMLLDVAVLALANVILSDTDDERNLVVSCIYALAALPIDIFFEAGLIWLHQPTEEWLQAEHGVKVQADALRQLQKKKLGSKSFSVADSTRMDDDRKSKKFRSKLTGNEDPIEKLLESTQDMKTARGVFAALCVFLSSALIGALCGVVIILATEQWEPDAFGPLLLHVGVGAAVKFIVIDPIIATVVVPVLTRQFSRSGRLLPYHAGPKSDGESDNEETSNDIAERDDGDDDDEAPSSARLSIKYMSPKTLAMPTEPPEMEYIWKRDKLSGSFKVTKLTPLQTASFPTKGSRLPPMRSHPFSPGTVAKKPAYRVKKTGTTANKSGISNKSLAKLQEAADVASGDTNSNLVSDRRDGSDEDESEEERGENPLPGAPSEDLEVSVYEAVSSGGSFLWKKTGMSGSWRVKKLGDKDIEQAEQISAQIKSARFRSSSYKQSDSALSAASFRSVESLGAISEQGQDEAGSGDEAVKEEEGETEEEKEEEKEDQLGGPGDGIDEGYGDGGAVPKSTGPKLKPKSTSSKLRSKSLARDKIQVLKDRAAARVGSSAHLRSATAPAIGPSIDAHKPRPRAAAAELANRDETLERDTPKKNRDKVILVLSSESVLERGKKGTWRLKPLD
jgi:hypothetical protein